MSGLANGWYRNIVKPGWAPPDYILSLCWVAVYLSMGLSAWGIWQTENRRRLLALMALPISVSLSSMWAWVSFAQMNLKAAAWLSLLALLASLYTTVVFVRVSKKSGAALGLYLVWSLLMSYLFIGILRLNP